MPVSHSHQLLCVSFSPLTIGVTRVGFSGVVTSQISWPVRAKCAKQIEPCSCRPSAGRRRCRCAPSAPDRDPALLSATRNVSDVFRLAGIGDVDDRRAVVLHLAGQQVRHRAGVMPDVGDIAIALLLDDRLVGAARLQIVGPEQASCRAIRRRAAARIVVTAHIPTTATTAATVRCHLLMSLLLRPLYRGICAGVK